MTDGSRIKVKEFSDPLSSRPLSYAIIEPIGYDENQSYPLLIFMHGLGDSVEHMLERYSEVLTRWPFFIAIPQGPYEVSTEGRKGYSWYTKTGDNQAVLDDMEWVRETIVALREDISLSYSVDTSDVVLSGFSQGGRLTYYIGLHHPELFSKLLPIAGNYVPLLCDPLLDNPTAKRLPMTIFHGVNDAVIPLSVSEEVYEKLYEKGFDVMLMPFADEHVFGPIFDDVLQSVLM